jgi:hypothetical protein
LIPAVLGALALVAAAGFAPPADPATELQTKIDSVAKQGGGVVNVPAGVLEVKRPIVLDSRVTLRGEGPATVIRLAAGKKHGDNEAVVMTRNFTKAIGKNLWNYRGGTPKPGLAVYGEAEGLHMQFAVEDLTIDGNARSGATGGGLYVYGAGYRISNVGINDVSQHGIWSECGNRPEMGASSAGDAEYRWFNMHEALIEHVKINMTGGHGIWWRGPNDSTIDHAVIARPKKSGLLADVERGVIQAGALKLGWIHVYPGGSEPEVWIKAWKIKGGSFYIDSPETTGLLLEGSDCHLNYVEVELHNRARANDSFGVSITGNGNRIDSMFYDNSETKEGLSANRKHGGALQITGRDNVVAGGELRNKPDITVPGKPAVIKPKSESSYDGKTTKW